MITKLLLFDGKIWNRWSIQMRVLFNAQDVLDFVNDSYVQVSFPENATDAQRNAQRDMRKKDQNTLFYIHQCMNVNMFEKIVDLMTMKAAWDTLVRCYGGDASVKKIKLQYLHKQYEDLSMNNNENVHDYASRVIMITMR